MRLRRIRIENFRSFADETIEFDDYTCLVGPNGAGKSAVLTALNVFFRNNASTVTDVHALSEEDFHHMRTAHPVKITLTFSHLSADAQKDLKHYVRQDQLVVVSKAQWNQETRQADVRQYGARLVMSAFAPFFEADDEKAKVAALKSIYEGIRAQHPDLPAPGTKQAMVDALRAYEEAHPEQCELIDDPNQFYGWSRGENLLSKHAQWVYIPAVKDASTEQEEGGKTALGQLLERTVRTRVDFKGPIDDLRRKLQDDYGKIIEAERDTLGEVETSIRERLQRWASPAANLALNWHYDPSRAVTITEPVARVAIGEDGFMGEVPRLGHGMQRSFLLAILQELAGADQAGGPTLLLGFEEPELYQHPPQAQHIAAVLERLGTSRQGNSQIIVTSHSPYFVPGKGFENIRLVRKQGHPKASAVTAATYEAVAGRLATALKQEPLPPTALMTAIEQIMQPSQRELFFTRVAVLVEGIEDVAFLSTQLQLTNTWNQFRENGCHFVVCVGKSSMSRPLAIACEMNIPHFIVFDSDADDTGEDKRQEHRRTNSCILRLCNVDDFDALPSDTLWRTNVVMWRTNIGDVVRDDIGVEVWDAAEAKARVERGFVESVRRKNALLISATLEQLASEGKSSPVLTKLCDRILDFSCVANADARA